MHSLRLRSNDDTVSFARLIDYIIDVDKKHTTAWYFNHNGSEFGPEITDLPMRGFYL